MLCPLFLQPLLAYRKSEDYRVPARLALEKKGKESHEKGLRLTGERGPEDLLQ